MRPSYSNDTTKTENGGIDPFFGAPKFLSAHAREKTVEMFSSFQKMALENALLDLKRCSGDKELMNLCIVANKDENVKRQLIENIPLDRIMTYLGDNDRSSECRDVMNLLLIITLINNSQEAQNRMKECGNLTKLVTMLCVSLEKNQTSKLDVKTEYIIHAVAACFRRPLHHDNQTSSGRAIPQIVNYFKMILRSGQIPDQMCLWSLLKYLLDNNEENQELFVKSKGSRIVFSAMKIVIERKDEIDNVVKVLSKGISILIILKSDKSLHQKGEGFQLEKFFTNVLSLKDKKLINKSFTFLNNFMENNPPALEETEENLNAASKLELKSNFYRLKIRRKGNKLAERIRQMYESPKRPFRTLLNPKTFAQKFFPLVFVSRKNLSLNEKIDKAHKEAVGFSKEK